MQVHQLVHTLNYGDAISGEAIALKRLLVERGYESKIYSLHSHELVKDEATSWTRCAEDVAAAVAAGEQVVVVMHYSIASPLNKLFTELQGCTKAIVYHNLTPDSWFVGYNTRVVDDLRVGRTELGELLAQADIVLCDSDYNRQEALAYGAREAEVLPLVIDTAKWRIGANPGIQGVLRGHGGKNFLSVPTTESSVLGS